MKVIAIIVTHNRLALLKRSVAAARAQTRPCDEIIVINNASTDGTGEWLDAEAGITVIHQGNEGGAGGFHTGIRTAYEAGADWVWCMDDDTIPESNALEALLSVSKAKDEKTGFLGSRVLWRDGSAHEMNRQPLHQDPMSIDDMLAERVARLTLCSFVSVLLARRAIAACGLPIREFFIWNDDVEYTQRILEKGFKGYLVLDSVALHDTPENIGAWWDIVSEKNLGKTYCGMRNTLFIVSQIQGQPILRWPRAIRLFFHMAQILRRNLPSRLAFRTIAALAWNLLFFRPKAITQLDEASACQPASKSASLGV